jgi:hypothetical protein
MSCHQDSATYELARTEVARKQHKLELHRAENDMYVELCMHGGTVALT